jgi:hypothetical protein
MQPAAIPIAMVVSLGAVFALIEATCSFAQTGAGAEPKNVYASPYCTPNLDGPEELKLYCERSVLFEEAGDCSEGRRSATAFASSCAGRRPIMNLEDPIDLHPETRRPSISV